MDKIYRYAKLLLKFDLAADLTALTQKLYSQPPINDITDDDIMAEIKAMRQQNR